MLSFKQYLAQYPHGHKAKTNQSFLQHFDSRRLSETESRSGDQGSTISKWDLIRLIAEDPKETVMVELKKDSVVFSFVDVEIE
jgi:hypothetical protein